MLASILTEIKSSLVGTSQRPLQPLPMSLLVIFVCCIRLASGITRSEAAETRCIERERRALLQFKQGIVDDHDILSSWGSHVNTQDCCLWRGVGCNNKTGHVIMLDLHGYWSEDLGEAVGFSGEMNSSLLELHHLKHLDLSFNSFTQIPEFIGSLGKLRYLNLSGINLEVSKVPPQLGNLSYLQTLDLAGSSIVLKNTEWFSKLSSLEYLSLNYIDLSESNNLLQNVITQIPSLFELHLRACHLPKKPANFLLPSTNFSKSLSVLDILLNDLPSSSVYPWLFNFSGSLTYVDLSYNELLGPIPEAFGAFTSLQNLDLTSNGLEGGIPRSFGNFSNLRLLYLGENNLTEDLPRFFHNLSGPAEKSIQVLDLSPNKLSGSLPDFSTFTALRELHLKDNQLDGFFPEKFKQISNIFILDLAGNQIRGLLPDLSPLSSLTELYFERNHLQGTLGERIMPLSELKFLGASSNLLNGTVTETHLTNLSHLVYLDLSSNSLVLELNSDWSPAFRLDTISLSSCKLGPSFPTWLQTQNFSIIDISNAQINDAVPGWFWEQLTPSLRYLNLSSNQIHGTVPNMMYGDQPYIDLSSNNFSGTVPLFPSNTQMLILSENMFSGSISFLCNFTTIGRLDLSYNQLSGELPDCWMNLTQLMYLSLENNNFTGRIPPSMGFLSYTRLLSLRRNSLTGELPSSLENCTFLQLLDLGENKLSGRLPTWIGKSLSGLVVLSLPSNGFFGTIPTSFCRLAKLQILDISVNNISGNIAKCLVNIKGMSARKTDNSFIGFSVVGLERTRLILSRSWYVLKALVQWKGRVSEYGSTLGLVAILDLSSNAFNGEIPGEITNLSGLVALNLSRNNLTRKIPQDIGRLRWLDFLDVSRNHLVGGIPTSLSQLTNLGVLDLSSNNLSGRIPKSTQLQSFDASSYTGNPSLCGLPLPNTCPGDFVPPSPGPTVETDDVGGQDELITRGFFISFLIGLAFGFWGVCGTLVVSDSWRYAYFEFLRYVKDWIYVAIAVNYARLHRRS